MKTLALVQKYESYIQHLIAESQIIAPEEILIKLLDFYTKSFPQTFFSTSFSSSNTHWLFVETLKKELTKNKHILSKEYVIQLTDAHIRTNPLQEEDELRILLIVFFKYYQCLFYFSGLNLSDYSEFSKHIALAAHTYDQISMANCIETLLKSDTTSNELDVLQMLAQIDIPHGQLEKIIGWLQLNIDKVVLALQQHLNPLNYQESEVTFNRINSLPIDIYRIIINALLLKLSDAEPDVFSVTCDLLGRLQIPEEQLVAIVDILLTKLDDGRESVESRACYLLRGLKIPEEQLGAAVDALLVKLHDGRVSVEVAAYALSHLKIPEHKVNVMVDALLAKLSDEAPNIRQEACKAFDSLKIPEHKIDIVADALLAKLSDEVSNIRQEACRAFWFFKIPEHKVAAVIDALLVKLSDAESSVQKEACVALSHACTVSNTLKIPEHMVDTVVDALLVKLGDDNRKIWEYACIAFDNLKLIVPDHKADAVVNALLNRLDDLSPVDVQVAACGTLASFKIPEHEIDTVINALLIKLTSQVPDIQTAACEALNCLKIPRHKMDAIVDTLSVKLSDEEPRVQEVACRALDYLSLHGASNEKMRGIALQLFAMYCLRDNWQDNWRAKLAARNALLGENDFLSLISLEKFVVDFCYQIKSYTDYMVNRFANIGMRSIDIDWLNETVDLSQRLPMEYRIQVGIYVTIYIEVLLRDSPQHATLNALLLYFKSQLASNQVKEKILYQADIPLEIQELVIGFDMPIYRNI